MKGKEISRVCQRNPSGCCCFKSGHLHCLCLPHSWHLLPVSFQFSSLQAILGPILSKCFEIFLHLTHLPFLDLKSWKKCANLYTILSTARWSVSFSSLIFHKKKSVQLFPSVDVFWKTYFWQWRIYVLLWLFMGFLHKNLFSILATYNQLQQFYFIGF